MPRQVVSGDKSNLDYRLAMSVSSQVMNSSKAGRPSRGRGYCSLQGSLHRLRILYPLGIGPQPLSHLGVVSRQKLGAALNGGFGDVLFVAAHGRIVQ